MREPYIINCMKYRFFILLRFIMEESQTSGWILGMHACINRFKRRVWRSGVASHAEGGVMTALRAEPNCFGRLLQEE
jgi:hypothetical protein